MKAVSTFETPISYYETTKRNILEDGHHVEVKIVFSEK
jgi:hypothetical protein